MSPALRMLPTEIRDNVEEPGIGAFWVAFQDACADVLWSRRTFPFMHLTDTYSQINLQKKNKSNLSKSQHCAIKLIWLLNWN